MRLEWLEDILAVVEAGSFFEAAERRRLTQSAFSRRIRHIEEQLRVDLFDRSRKPVQVSPTLRSQHEQIVKVVGLMHQLVEDLRHGDRAAESRVVLVSPHTLTTSQMPKLMRQMERIHPHVHVSLRSANLDDCYTLLLSRRADIALVYYVIDEGLHLQQDYIETELVGTDNLIPVCLASMASTLHRAEATLPLIAYPREVFLGKVLERAILPKVRLVRPVVEKVETALTLAALELVLEGIGIAWIPQSLAHLSIREERIADLSAHLPTCALGLAAVRVKGPLSAGESAVWKAVNRLHVDRRGDSLPNGAISL